MDVGHGKELDAAPGVIGLSEAEYPPLPDAVVQDPTAGRLDPRGWFAHPSRPLELEIGCGKGTFILNASGATQETNFLGVEWEGLYFAYTADRLRRAGRTNTRMLHADGVEFLRWRCPNDVFAAIHLYYSDPWPKARHHKNRVVQDRFLQESLRCLVPGGTLRIVTDHDDYWAWMQPYFARWCGMDGGFQRESFVAPAWAGEGAVVATNYERKMCGDHKEPHAVVLRKPARGGGE